MKKAIWFLGRFVLYLFSNFVWMIIALPLLKLAKRLKRPLFRYMFLVYPGTLDQARGYIPLWLRKFAPLISIIGVITGEHRGLVITVPYLIEELENGGNGDRYPDLREVADKVSGLANSIGAKAVALAGRMPSLLHQNGGIFPPIVAGDKGAVYTVLEVTKQAMHEAGLEPNKTIIGLLGYGFLGRRVAKAIQGWGSKVIAVDPRVRVERDNGFTLTRDPAVLNSCDVVIVLTAKGIQAETAVEYGSPGALWVDDTHPQMPRRLVRKIESIGGKVVKATLTRNGTRFYPRLPKWGAKWLPGCCVEAIVVASNGADGDFVSQVAFNQAATQMNFWAPQVRHKSEL